MNYVEKTPKNWAKDNILTGEILAALDSTEGKDFVFAVSVQGHGKYPEDKQLSGEESEIRVTGGIEERVSQFHGILC